MFNLALIHICICIHDWDGTVTVGAHRKLFNLHASETFHALSHDWFQLNRKRTTARRKPDGISSVVPAFDPTLFNFNKVDSREVLLEVKSGNCSVAIMINNSPLTKFHFLIVPDRSQNMAQILTQDSLEAVFKIFLLMGDHRYRMGFNSPGALASVNHLHYHFMLMCHKLYVEDAVSIWSLFNHHFLTFVSSFF